MRGDKPGNLLDVMPKKSRLTLTKLRAISEERNRTTPKLCKGSVPSGLHCSATARRVAGLVTRPKKWR